MSSNGGKRISPNLRTANNRNPLESKELMQSAPELLDYLQDRSFPPFLYLSCAVFMLLVSATTPGRGRRRSGCCAVRASVVQLMELYPRKFKFKIQSWLSISGNCPFVSLPLSIIPKEHILWCLILFISPPSIPLLLFQIIVNHECIYSRYFWRLRGK